MHLYTQLEYCPGGTLAQLKERGGAFTEANALAVAQQVPCHTFPVCDECVAQVAGGLQYLHAQGLVHRELSSHSLFVAGDQDSPSIKIGHLRGLVRGSHVEESQIDWTDPAQARALCCASYEAVHETMTADRWPGADIFAMGMSMLDLATHEELPSRECTCCCS